MLLICEVAAPALVRRCCGCLRIAQIGGRQYTHEARGCRLGSRPTQTANSPSRTGKLMEQERRSSSHTIVETVILPLVAVAFAAAIFAIETFTPLGLAVAVLYVVASGRRTPCAAARPISQRPKDLARPAVLVGTSKAAKSVGRRRLFVSSSTIRIARLRSTWSSRGLIPTIAGSLGALSRVSHAKKTIGRASVADARGVSQACPRRCTSSRQRARTARICRSADGCHSRKTFAGSAASGTRQSLPM
jgi:hypothetical protein